MPDRIWRPYGSEVPLKAADNGDGSFSLGTAKGAVRGGTDRVVRLAGDPPTDFLAVNNGDGSFSLATTGGSGGGGFQVLVDAPNIAWDLSKGSAKVTLGGDRVMANPTNMVAGQRYSLLLVQDGAAYGLGWSLFKDETFVAVPVGGYGIFEQAGMDLGGGVVPAGSPTLRINIIGSSGNVSVVFRRANGTVTQNTQWNGGGGVQDFAIPSDAHDVGLEGHIDNNPSDVHIIILYASDAGKRAISWGSNYFFGAFGYMPPLTAGVGAIDHVEFVCDGTALYCVAVTFNLTKWSFAPPITSGLQLWLSANKPATLWQDAARTTHAAADNDPVGAWDDLSGQGWTAFTQATAGLRPLLKLNIMNGRPVLRFDGVDDYLRGVNGLAQPLTIIMVTAMIAGNPTLFDGVGGGPTTVYGGIGAVYNLHFGAVVAGGNGDAANHVMTAIVNGATSSLWLDGANLGMGAGGGNNMASITLANNRVASAAGNIYIAEFLAYNRVLTAIERAAIERELGSAYGIAVA